MQNNGLILCAKYAFPPNLLKYCGPEDNRALFEILDNKDIGAELRNLLSQFEGVVPYLKLIAQANKIKDIFDWRVVEAYWLGNNLLNKIEAKDMFFNMEERFKKKMKKEDWNYMLKNSMEQAKPHHNFHVLEVYRRTGFLKSGVVEKLLETINNCCILWGRVVATELIHEQNSHKTVLVEYHPIEFFENKLRFGAKQTKKVDLIDSSIKKDDEVTFHWDYVCDKITLEQKRNLIFWTKFHLDLTNKTI